MNSARTCLTVGLLAAVTSSLSACGKASDEPPGAESRMVAALAEIRSHTADENAFLGDRRIRELREGLEKRAGSDPADDWRARGELGERLVYYGDERAGLDMLREAREQIPTVQDKLHPGEVESFLIHFAGCWLRLAESENCCAHHVPESCILPLAGPSLHSVTEGSRKAILLLDEVLRTSEPRSKQHLRALWMRNLAAMTLGEYPDQVPQEWRIPPSYFAGDETFPRFENVASKVGLDDVNLAGGAIADDFDGDGDMDLMVSSWSTDGQLRYYRNEGDGTFSNRTKEAGLVGLVGGLNLIQGDYDNDGKVDALVLRGAWLGKEGRHPNSLLHNDGHGRFTDRTYQSGLGAVSWPTMTAVWLDYDGDGDLDLYVGNETTKALEAPCQLFRNNGDGTFTDVAAAAGVTNDRFTRNVLSGDYDGDGKPDLYVSNLEQLNRLYHNKGDGTFEDVAPKLSVTGPSLSYSGWFWDYDNDGLLDLMVLSFESKPEDSAAAALGLPFESEVTKLYKANGRGGFDDVGGLNNLWKPYSAMGCNLGDFDNDGFLDFYVGTGRPAARDLVPNMAFHNRRGKGFADVTLPSGLGNLQKGHGIAFADFDLDGDLDIFAQMGGAYRADVFHNCLFENPGFQQHWLAVRLEGRKSNRSAIGARIRAEIVEDGERRSVYRTVGSGGGFGANPLRQHVGLGRTTKVEVLEVLWPATGKTQVFKNLPADRYVEIVEGEETPKVTELKAVHLGGGPRPSAK